MFIQSPMIILFAKFSRPYVYSLPYVYSGVWRRRQSLFFQRTDSGPSEPWRARGQSAQPDFDRKRSEPSPKITTCSPKVADFPTALKLSKQTVKQYGNNFILNGQLISKCLFGIFLQFSKKTNKKWYFKLNSFRSFFGRIENTKKTFRN